MLSVNLDKSLVFVIVSCYFLNLFPFNFVFSRGGQGPPLELPGGARGLLPPLCTPLYSVHCTYTGIRTVYTVHIPVYNQDSMYIIHPSPGFLQYSKERGDREYSHIMFNFLCIVQLVQHLEDI